MTNNTLEQSLPIKKRRRRRPKSWLLKLLRQFLRFSSHIFPGITSRLIYRLWFRTQRFTRPQRENEYARRSAYHHIIVNGERVRIYTWGSGPVVLLMHGWNGRGTQLGAFIEPLLQQGYRVVTFDAPGHGESTAKRSTLFQFSDSAIQISQRFGPIDSIIAHSFGAPAAVHAIASGLSCQRVIMISPPASLLGLLEKFTRITAISNGVIRRFKQRFEKDYGKNIWHIGSTVERVSSLKPHGLIIHDQHDYDVPVAEAQEIHAAWPGSEIYITQQLGHRRILRHPLVIERIITFLSTD